MKKLSNNQIIQKLLPYLKTGIEKLKNNQIEFNEKDYYGHPCYEEYFENGEIILRYTDYDERIIIEAVMIFERGKYGHATLEAQFIKETKEVLKTKSGTVYGFAKEFRGKGNGYYADVDENGKIIRREWD